MLVIECRPEFRAALRFSIAEGCFEAFAQPLLSLQGPAQSAVRCVVRAAPEPLSFEVDVSTPLGLPARTRRLVYAGPGAGPRGDAMPGHRWTLGD